MLACTNGHGNVVIGRSDDEGETWTAPITLFPMCYKNGYHSAPGSVSEYGGLLYIAVDTGGWSDCAFPMSVLTADADKDLLDPANWELAEFTDYDPLMQEETAADDEKYVTPGIGELIRQAGAESCVLLKNNGVLPISRNMEVAVFGRCQLDWFYVGYGSGGDVHAPYHVNLIEGLRGAGIPVNADVLSTYETWTQQEENRADHGWWGHWPMNHPEMPLETAFVRKAAQASDAALVVIGRAAGDT